MHGRAGRENLPGKVIIQTYNPDNFSIECSKKQNYKMFYDIEILLRKQLKYPPFCDIIVIGFSGKTENEVKLLSSLVYEDLSKNLAEEDFKVMKPMPSPIDKIQNKYRWRIIIKGKLTEEANEILTNCLKKVYKMNYKGVRIGIDVNPNNMI